MMTPPRGGSGVRGGEGLGSEGKEERGKGRLRQGGRKGGRGGRERGREREGD